MTKEPHENPELHREKGLDLLKKMPPCHLEPKNFIKSEVIFPGSKKIRIRRKINK